MLTSATEYVEATEPEPQAAPCGAAPMDLTPRGGPEVVYLDEYAQAHADDPDVQRLLAKTPNGTLNAKMGKALRGKVLAKYHQDGKPPPKVYMRRPCAAPAICNRVGVPEPLPEHGTCECTKWPQWLHDNPDQWETRHEMTVQDGRVKAGGKAAYLRPGKQAKAWWYEGLVTDVYRVRVPRSNADYVVARVQ